tara:strand:- start:770 stop:1159 length:390 start_codon:yes stop_codon:yes gene_type:complete
MYSQDEINEFRKASLIEDMQKYNGIAPQYTTDKALKISLFKTHLERLEQLASEEPKAGFLKSCDLDAELIKATLLASYEAFESSMSLEELEEYVEEYVAEVAHSGDREAYENITIAELLEDFKTFVELS